MTHHHSLNTAATTRCANTTETTRPTTVLLHLDLFFDRAELATLNRFLDRHPDTVRVLGADGEHHSVDARAAHEFLAVLVRHTDRETGLLALEAEADSKQLTRFERTRLVAAKQFEPDVLHAEGAPSEDTCREGVDMLFTQETWEIWNEAGTELLGRAKSYKTGQRITQSFREEGVPAVLAKTKHTFYPV